MDSNWKQFIAGLACACVLLPLGCDSGTTPSDDASAVEVASGDGHDHAHDHAPADLSEGLAQLSKHVETIKTAFENNTPDDAHGALHDVGHVLESIPALAEKGGSLTSEQMDSVKQQTEALFDAFTTLDETMHGGEAVEYSELDTKIQDAMSALTELAK